MSSFNIVRTFWVPLNYRDVKKWKKIHEIFFFYNNMTMYIKIDFYFFSP
jgi:hypothetical protein